MEPRIKVGDNGGERGRGPERMVNRERAGGEGRKLRRGEGERGVEKGGRKKNW